MSTSREGQAVRRVRGDRRLQRSPWHRVDSTISDDAVTNCGVRMDGVQGTRQRSRTWRFVPGPDNTLEYENPQYLDLVFFYPLRGSRPCQRCWK